jgi:hypothetical protein
MPGATARRAISEVVRAGSPIFYAARRCHVEATAAAYELGADLQSGGSRIDTHRMPADAPARDGAVPVPSPAHPWAAAFLAGNVTALDARLA